MNVIAVAIGFAITLIVAGVAASLLSMWFVDIVPLMLDRWTASCDPLSFCGLLATAIASLLVIGAGLRALAEPTN